MAPNTPDEAKRNVVITGFGLFREHKANPSWDAIASDELKIDRPSIKIIKKQVDVIYAEVDRVVEDLWKTYDPLLMIHIGLAAIDSRIRIEQVARHGPYIHDDVAHEAPHKDLRIYEGETHEEGVKRHRYTCKPCKFESSRTCLNVDRVCDKMNYMYEHGLISIPFKKSTDAGLYVCEYIYQKSLRICDRTVFIHVPDTDTHSLYDIRTALKYTIEVLIDESKTRQQV